MRLTAIILAGLATLAVAGGIFGYWVGAAFTCFDVCPPAATFSGTWLRMLAIFLGPGLLLSLGATGFAILSLVSEGRTTATFVVVAAPIVAVVAMDLILIFVAGSLAPLATAGSPDVAEAQRQLSQPWLGGTSYAVIPLIVWPLATCLAALIRPSRSS
jgi:hypothetical protein